MSLSHDSLRPPEGFQFGRITNSGTCCFKPHGCSIPGGGCIYMQHPWKRLARGEITRAEYDRLTHQEAR